MIRYLSKLTISLYIWLFLFCFSKGNNSSNDNSCFYFVSTTTTTTTIAAVHEAVGKTLPLLFQLFLGGHHNSNRTATTSSNSKNNKLEITICLRPWSGPKFSLWQVLILLLLLELLLFNCSLYSCCLFWCGYVFVVVAAAPVCSLFMCVSVTCLLVHVCICLDFCVSHLHIIYLWYSLFAVFLLCFTTII